MPVKLNSSGGGSVTLDVGSTASTYTLNLPLQNGTLAVSTGPAFAAYLNTNQTVTNGTLTKVQLAVEEYDTNNNYDTSLYRFTPTVAGYYQLNGGLQGGGSTNTTGVYCAIYKNGANYRVGAFPRNSGASNMDTVISTLVYMNGSTDYVELWGYVEGSGTMSFVSSTTILTWFNGFLARAA